MNLQEKNKQFIQNYHRDMRNALQQSKEAFWETAHRYIVDQKLIDHIAFFIKAFPNYNLEIEDAIAEGDKVFEKAIFIGKHEGEMNGIPATHQEAMVPFGLCFTVRDEKIVDFWAIANEMDFLEQLGISKEQVEVRPEKFS